ncbi:hypothetical protein F5884DRAFT_3134 [Xylogone sp. PMI_703]|nr:hypothetical protein F5884DRAFT_3134 [Xylogone sp. PMI_703]
MNVFMAMLQQEADDKQDGSLFLDSDFFSGINKCISCRAHEAQCDMLDQQGGHCTQCRQMGLICEMPRPSTKLNIDNFHKFNRIFVPTFTKEITHWSLVVISPQKKSVVHFDSLDFSGPDKPAVLSYPLREVVTWVRHLISLAKWDSEGWHEEAVFVSKQPAGGNDCGICTISFARLLQSGLPLPPPGYFTVPLMAKMREVFKTEMLEGKFGNNFYRFQEAQQH